MLTIKTPTDLHQLPSNHSLYTPAKTLLERLIVPYHHPEKPYNADEEGFIVICEDGDQDGPLTSLWPDEPYTLADIPWEGVMKRPGYYEGIFLANNEFGIIFFNSGLIGFRRIKGSPGMLSRPCVTLGILYEEPFLPTQRGNSHVRYPCPQDRHLQIPLRLQRPDLSPGL